MKATMNNQIHTSAAMRRFNRAIEQADELSGYRFDRCLPEQLWLWLDVRGNTSLAVELESAARAVGQWPAEPISRA